MPTVAGWRPWPARPAWLPTALYGHLVAGGLLTILLGVGAAALGAPAPVTLASLVVAVLLLVGGPRVTV